MASPHQAVELEAQAGICAVREGSSLLVEEYRLVWKMGVRLRKVYE